MKALLVAAAVAATLATAAAAAPFPAQHYPFTPVGGAALKNGFVENIHPDGSEVYARHVYVLNGAARDTSYNVVISIWTSSLACAGEPDLVIPAATLVTNESGNGHAEAVFDPEVVAALGLRGLTIGGNVTLFHEGSPAYTIGCQVVEFD